MPLGGNYSLHLTRLLPPSFLFIFVNSVAFTASILSLFQPCQNRKGHF